MNQAARAGAGAARRDRSSALARAHLRTEPAYAAAGCVLHDAVVDAESAGAGLGAPDVRIGDVQVVAGDRDVEIVFERQRDRVVHRNIKFAIMHELVDARRIGQVRRRYMARGL